MGYDFDTPVNRRGTDSLKWDVKDGELPMWVADMDFQAAPEIREALRERLDHGVFGYSRIPDEWYGAYIRWWDRRHHFQMKKEWLVFCTGVVPAISSIVRKLTTPNENVLIQTPVYNIFFNSIRNNGCRVVESPLIYDGQKFTVDFGDLERKMEDPQTTLMILCNPHNPIGKIWDRDTLAKIGALAKKHHVTVISDEIHCDITKPGTEYVPFASVSEDCLKVGITCIAPTKAFNLAGLQTAAVSIEDSNLRHKVWRGLNTDEVAEPNSFAVAAAIAAFEQGEPWLDDLREYVFGNIEWISDYIKKEIPEISVVESEATYLMWLDIGRISGRSREFAGCLRSNTGLFVSAGSSYGTAGDCFIRLNAACPRSVCMEGARRLKAGVEQFMASKKK